MERCSPAYTRTVLKPIQCRSAIWCLNTAPTSVKIWLSERDIGMELSFRRITVEQLDEVLARDHERANQEVDKAVPPEIRSLISGYRSCPDAKKNMKDMLSRSDLPVHIREAVL